MKPTTETSTRYSNPKRPLVIEAYNRLVSSDDRHEGVRAFNERRAPRFTGQ